MAEDRARSFIERYVIARAPHFRVGFEQEDAHAATLMGKSVYRHIHNVAKDAEPNPFEIQQHAGVGQSTAPLNPCVIGPSAGDPWTQGVVFAELPKVSVFEKFTALMKGAQPNGTKT